TPHLFSPHLSSPLHTDPLEHNLTHTHTHTHSHTHTSPVTFWDYRRYRQCSAPYGHITGWLCLPAYVPMQHRGFSMIANSSLGREGENKRGREGASERANKGEREGRGRNIV